MPNKPTRVRYSGVAPFIDDTQANRVQALGSSSRLTTEDIKELGTLNIVEVVDDVPVVDISIDQNENGTNDLLALFSNKGYGCNVVAVPTGNQIGSTNVKVLAGSYYANGNRIFFEGIDSLAVPSGSNQKVYLNPVPTGGASAKVAVTGGSVPAGAITIATISGSSTIKQSDIADNRPFSSVGHLDFELAKVDMFVPVMAAGETTVSRTMYMERTYVNSIDLNYGTTGVATASFRLETDNKRWFLNSNSQIIVDQFKATAGTTLTLSYAPSVLANGNYLLTLIKNGSPLTEGTDFTVSGTTVTFTSSLSSGDLVKARYSYASNGPFFVPVPVTENPHPELAGGLKQGQVELYLSDNTSSRVTRVQSARISVPLPREMLHELGSLYPYDRPMQLPINVTVSIEIKDSDLELMARFAGMDVTTATEIALSDLVKNLGLTIKLYRENDITRAKLAAGHPSKYAIKTISITNLIPQNENWSARVDSDASQTFDFMAHNVTISDSIQ